MAGSGEKLGMNPWISQPTCWGLCRKPVSWEQWLCPSLSMTSQKDATYKDRLWEAYTGCTWTGVGSVCVMLVGFSPTGCTSI
jgi:hypothetical protein